MKRVFLILAVLSGLCGPLSAQDMPDSRTRLDQLYQRLARAQSEEEARSIDRLIAREEEQSGSATVDLLMGRASGSFGDAVQSKQKATQVIELLSAVIRMRPDFAAAWNKRASAYMLLARDYGRATKDLLQAVARDPRQYSAWNSLAMIMLDIGDKKHAYEALKKVIEINPQMPGARKAFDALRADVEGRDI